MGGIISFILGSLYLFDPVEMGGYQLPLSLILSASLIAGLLMGAVCWLAVKTVRMKRNITAMGTVLNEIGEVTRLLNKQGTKGWILIYGENWRFKSKETLKVGDLVKVIKEERMFLRVKKVEEDEEA